MLEREGEKSLPKTFLTILLSPASMSIKNSGDASELISFMSIKSTFVLDIWTVNKSGFKIYKGLVKCISFKFYQYAKSIPENPIK